MPNPVVTVENLGKDYWLYPSMKRRLLGCFMDPRRLGAHAFCALSGLTFELYPGEAIAIIGKNGAGKSTALQVLAGITPATKGTFQINGRVCALLELGSGFNPEFTGRQNIALAGALLGLTHEQIRQEEENIITFADIGEFIDQPVKFYSSGMFVRLAFAVAVAGQPDLLIVDEALAVGDIFFRQKCYARLREMRAKGMAVILVTHSQGDVTEFCDRAILLEHGKQTYIGDPNEVMARYYISMQPATTELQQSVSTMGTVQDVNAYDAPFPESLLEHFSEVSLDAHTLANGGRLLRFCLANEQNIPCYNFVQGSRLRLYAQFAVNQTSGTPISAITILTHNGIAVYSKGTPHYAEVTIPTAVEIPSLVFVCHEVQLNLAPGEYTITLTLNEVAQKVYENRHVIAWEEWIEGCKSRIGAMHLLAFSVSVPAMRRPSRYAGAGLVDLPGCGWMTVRPMA